MNLKHRLLKFVIIVIVVLQAGCITKPSPPANFYILTAIETEPSGKLDQGVVIGIGPVNLPTHMERSQIVRQADSNQLSVDEFNRWAGDLEQNIADVLAENISKRLSLDSVVVYPWGQDVAADYQVVVNVRRFNLGLDGNIHLIALWRLLENGANRLLVIKREEIQVETSALDYNSIAAAQSKALLILGRSISEHIRHQ